PDFSAKPVGVRTNIEVSWAGSTSSPALLGKRSAAPAAASPAGERKLSIFCANVHGHTCFPTQSRHRLSPHPLKRSNFSALRQNFGISLKKTPNISALP